MGNNNETYQMPLEITLKLPTHIFFMVIISGIILTILPFILIMNNVQPSTISDFVLARILSPVLGLFLIIASLQRNVFQLHRIRIDDQGIKSFSPFKKKEIRWKRVVNITTYTRSHNDYLGFITIDRLQKHKEKGAFTELSASYGGLYELVIPLGQLGKLNKERVVFTIKEAYNAVVTDNLDEINKDIEEYNADLTPDEVIIKKPNYLLAIVSTLFITIVFSVVYCLSILFFHVNILLIPVISIALVVYYYSKIIHNARLTPLSRLWLLFLTIFSFYLTRMLLIFIPGKIEPTINTIIEINNEYFSRYLINNIGDEYIWLLLAISLCLVVLYVTHNPSKITHKIKSLFMKKLGNIKYERSANYFSLYFIKPEDYFLDESKLLMEISRGCQIEQRSRKPVFFKIPIEIINENEINIDHNPAFIKDEQYLHINLGGSGVTQEYVYDVQIILNSRREIEIINLETH